MTDRGKDPEMLDRALMMFYFEFSSRLPQKNSGGIFSHITSCAVEKNRATPVGVAKGVKKQYNMDQARQKSPAVADARTGDVKSWPVS